MSSDPAVVAAEKIFPRPEYYVPVWEIRIAETASFIREAYASTLAEKDAALSAWMDAAKTQHAEVERLQTIVRARTHRENGCICENCVADEYETAAEVERLRQEKDQWRADCAVVEWDRDRLVVENAELKAEVIRLLAAKDAEVAGWLRTSQVQDERIDELRAERDALAENVNARICASCLESHPLDSPCATATATTPGDLDTDAAMKEAK